MKVILNLGKTNFRLKKPYLAIGVFDGVHRGHQALLKKIVTRARKNKGTSVIMTFDPHPVHVLHPERDCPLIVSFPHRLKLFSEMNVDVCIVIPFTKSFSHLTPEQFIKTYLVDSLKPAEIFVGDDFRFGQNRMGDLNYFKEAAHQYGFKVNIVRAVKGNDRAISSTWIREFIAKGNLLDAQKLLGHRVSLMGKVVSGESRGKILGFPTANLNPASEVIPPAGVYLVYVWIKNKRFNALANLGYNPTFNGDLSKTKMEVHILDFNRNIYGSDLVVEFIKKIRNEKKFLSAKHLIEQIQADRKQAQKFFRI